jgi:hypothetical protein
MVDQSGASGASCTSFKSASFRAALILRAAAAYQGCSSKVAFRRFVEELAGLDVAWAFPSLLCSRSRLGINASTLQYRIRW